MLDRPAPCFNHALQPMPGFSLISGGPYRIRECLGLHDVSYLNSIVIEVAPYCIARTPVSLSDYDRYSDEHGYARLSPGVRHRSHIAAHPITPSMAQDYLSWLNQRYHARFRLPSETEWELCANEGFLPVGRTTLARAATDHYGGTQLFSAFDPNAFGVRAMIGYMWHLVEAPWEQFLGMPQANDYAVIRGASIDCYVDFIGVHARLRVPITALPVHSCIRLAYSLD